MKALEEMLEYYPGEKYEGHPVSLYDQQLYNESIRYNNWLRTREDWEAVRTSPPPDDMPSKNLIWVKFPKGIALNFKEVTEACLNKLPGSVYLNTIFGVATINRGGYLEITQSRKGNDGKLLHRLIYEHEYGDIPKGYQIHHVDGDKLNNYPLNLKAVTPYEHQLIHRSD